VWTGMKPMRALPAKERTSTCFACGAWPVEEPSIVLSHMPAGSRQAFLEAHERAIAYFGGVFEKIRYNNLKSELKRTHRGHQREEIVRFIALRSHWDLGIGILLSGRGPRERRRGRRRRVLPPSCAHTEPWQLGGIRRHKLTGSCSRNWTAAHRGRSVKRRRSPALWNRRAFTS